LLVTADTKGVIVDIGDEFLESRLLDVNDVSMEVLLEQDGPIDGLRTS
jgi:hypothetical protein